jgi:hypothetical protein
MTMTGHEEMLAAAEEAMRPPHEQSRLSRRTALRTAAAAGVAASALAATGAPALAAARPARPAHHARAGHHGTGRSEADHSDADHSDADQGEADGGAPIVAHLRNARTGEIDVFHGTSQTRLHDPALAAMLMRASR